MTRAYLGLVMTLAILLPGAAAAQTRGAADAYLDLANGLSLNDAIARALDRGPTVRTSQAGVGVARGMQQQAGSWANPMFSFEQREEPGGTDRQTMIGAEWPLELFRRSARKAVGAQEVSAAERAAEERARVVAADVRMAYGLAAAALRSLDLADRAAVAAESQLDVIRGRVNEGAAPPLARDVMDVEVQRMVVDRIMAVGRLEAAFAELKRAIGVPQTEPLRLREPIERLASQARRAGRSEVGAARSAVAAARSDVQEAESRVRLAETRVEEARSAGRLDITVFGAYTRMDAGFPQQGFNASGGLERVRGVFHYASAGARVMIPLANRNAGAVAAAEAAVAAATSQVEAATLAAEAELTAAIARADQASRALTSAERAAELARQNLTVVRETYDLGRATLADVLAEQRRALDAERLYTDVLWSIYEAETAVLRAEGSVR